MERWSNTTLAPSWSCIQRCVKMLLQLRLLKRPREQLRDGLATASLSQPLPPISHRVGICQAVTEDPGKGPLAKGHNAMVKLTGLAYGPSVAYGFNTEVIYKYNNTGKKNILVCILRYAISLL